MWAVVGWSKELVLFAERSNSLELVSPASGVPLHADVWAVPSGAEGGSMGTGPSPLLPSWLEFSTSPARAGTLMGLKSGG